MSYFLFKIAIRYARTSLIIWSLFFLFDFLSNKYFAGTSTYLVSFFGFGMAVFCGVSLSYGTRWPILWRRISTDINRFWVGIGMFLLFSVIFNTLCYFLARYLLNELGIPLLISLENPLDIVWSLVILCSFNILLLFDQKLMMANNPNASSKQVLYMFGIYGLIALLFPISIYSKLLGYMAGEISLVILIFRSNQFILVSLQKKYRIILGSTAIAFTFLLFGISYQIELRRTVGASDFLGSLGPIRVWNFADIEKISKPSEWVKWVSLQRETRSKATPEQRGQAMDKLLALCPVKVTDQPIVILCNEKDAESSGTYIYSEVEDSVILSNLKSENVYTKLLALVTARSLAEFSPELKSKLEEISRTPGRLGVVAEKTLAHHGIKHQQGIYVKVVDN